MYNEQEIITEAAEQKAKGLFSDVVRMKTLYTLYKSADTTRALLQEGTIDSNDCALNENELHEAMVATSKEIKATAKQLLTESQQLADEGNVYAERLHEMVIEELHEMSNH